MKLLITGSTGFVGRNLLLQALQDSSWTDIILPVRNAQKLQEQLQQENISYSKKLVHFCAVQKNRWSLDNVPSPDIAIHCAGLTFSCHREDYFNTHLQATLHLLDSLPKECRLLILSSQSAAGPTPAGIPIRRREHSENPVSWYGESKLAMEKKMAEVASDRLLIIRPPMILGPCDTATLPLFQMAKRFFRFKPGLKEKEYSWISVDDLCRALIIAAKSNWDLLPCRNYFITNPNTITDLELLSTTAQVLGKTGITLRLPHFFIQLISILLDKMKLQQQGLQSLSRDRVKEILQQRWVMDGSDFERDFSWKATTSLEQSLEQTAAWLKK